MSCDGDLLFDPVNMTEAADVVSVIPGVLMFGCKALRDSLKKSESCAWGMKDKRVAIKALALKRSFVTSITHLMWVHSLAQLVHCMAKDSEVGRKVFLKYIAMGRWEFVIRLRPKVYLSAPPSRTGT